MCEYCGEENNNNRDLGVNGRGVAEEKSEEDQRPFAEKNHFRDGKAVTDAVEYTVEENGENEPAQE